MCIILEEKRRKKSSSDPNKTKVSFSLFVMSVDGIYQDRIDIQDNLRNVRRGNLWLRESVRDEIDASVALSSLPFFCRYVRHMLVCEKVDYEPMK